MLKNENHYRLEILIIIILFICLIYFNFDKISLFLYPFDQNRNGESLKLIFSLFGGLAVLYGLYISTRRIKALENNVMNQTSELQLNKDSQIREQFKNAIEHLGNEKESIILGGIAELHEIATQHGYRYSSVITNVFASFIRSEGNKNKKREEINYTLLQTIIDYLFRTDIYDTKNLNLKSSNLSSLDLNNLNFEGIDFSFSILPMKMSNVLFKDCVLSKQSKSYCIWKDIRFENCPMFLSFFWNGIFENVYFMNSNIQMETSFYMCELKDVHFYYKEAYNIKFVRNYVKNSSFNGIKFLKSDFTTSSFEHVTFIDCHFNSHNFLGCDFSNTKIREGETFGSQMVGVGNSVRSNTFSVEMVLKEKIEVNNNLRGIVFENFKKIKLNEDVILASHINNYLLELEEFLSPRKEYLKKHDLL